MGYIYTKLPKPIKGHTVKYLSLNKTPYYRCECGFKCAPNEYHTKMKEHLNKAAWGYA